MKTAHDIIVRPIITENSMDLLASKTYVFECFSCSFSALTLFDT